MRMAGELLRARGDPEGAEGHLERALQIANGQSALLYELQAATALSELWQAAGRTEQALDLLNGVCSRLTDGIDFPAYRRTQTVLNALANAPP